MRPVVVAVVQRDGLVGGGWAVDAAAEVGGRVCSGGAEPGCGLALLRPGRDPRAGAGTAAAGIGGPGGGGGVTAGGATAAGDDGGAAELRKMVWAAR